MHESELSAAPLHTTHSCEALSKSVASGILAKCTYSQCCHSHAPPQPCLICLPAFLGSEIHQEVGKPAILFVLLFLLILFKGKVKIFHSFSSFKKWLLWTCCLSGTCLDPVETAVTQHRQNLCPDRAHSLVFWFICDYTYLQGYCFSNRQQERQML